MHVMSSRVRGKVLFYWSVLAVLLLGSAMAFPQQQYQDQDQNQPQDQYQNQSQDEDPPPEAGRLSAIQGNVSVQPAGAQDWGQAYMNLPLGPGDRIYTDQGSRAEIQVGQTYVRIGPNTDITLVDATSQAVTFGMGAGSADVHAFGLWPNQQLQVQTPSGTATVYQPTDFRTDVYAEQQADQDQQGGAASAVFTPFNGSVEVAGADDVGATVQAGQSFELEGTNPVYPQWLEPAGLDQLDQWSRTRDGQVGRARSYQYMSPGMPGGYELDDAGQWQAGTEYGNMWFPHVEAGWAPYRNGHWISRGPWGWVWVEDEPWGYAPFHYGRWVNYRGRWGWIPGPVQVHPVWSPALVVFAGGMQGGGGALSVWIPLGPGEPYRPWYRCSPRYIDRVNITNIQPAPRVQVRNTYVNITNVNITNITYVNRTVGATAVPREAFASGRQVRQVVVHVTPQQLAQARVEARPMVQPTRANLIARPATKPVPVKARPMLINSKGMAVAAQPHARPAPPPVRRMAAAPRPIPGRKVMAPPPNAKMTPAAQKAAQQRPAPGVAARPGQEPQGNRPGQPNANGHEQPGNRPGQPNAPGHPGQGNQPAERGGNARPGQGPEQHPGVPAPGAHPQPQQHPEAPGATPQRPGQEQPNARPGQQPPERPGQQHPERPGQQPGQQPERPGQQHPERPGMAPERPGNQQPNARPGEQPPTRPGQQPPERPNQQPNARPGGQPNNRPGEQPNAGRGPEQRQGPPQGLNQQQHPRPEQSPQAGRPMQQERPGAAQRPRQEQRQANPPERRGPPPPQQARPENRPAAPSNNARGNQNERNRNEPNKNEPNKNKPKPNRPDQNPPQ